MSKSQPIVALGLAMMLLGIVRAGEAKQSGRPLTWTQFDESGFTEGEQKAAASRRKKTSTTAQRYEGRRFYGTVKINEIKPDKNGTFIIFANEGYRFKDGTISTASQPPKSKPGVKRRRGEGTYNRYAEWSVSEDEALYLRVGMTGDLIGRMKDIEYLDGTSNHERMIVVSLEDVRLTVDR